MHKSFKQIGTNSSGKIAVVYVNTPKELNEGYDGGWEILFAWDVASWLDALTLGFDM